MPKTTDCVVVGAGIAGLFAARILEEHGWDVTVLDKGRGVGGRTATRRLDGARFDHGAQYFTVRDEQFRTHVKRWLAGGVITEWARGFTRGGGPTPDGQHPRYRGVGGMTAMAKELAVPLTVHTSTRVTRLSADRARWRVEAIDLGTDAPVQYIARALVMTPPAEQTLALLRESDVSAPKDVEEALGAIDYAPCVAALVQLDGPSAVPAPGGVFMSGEPIRWIADNQQKGISEVPTLTIHAGPELSRSRWADDPKDVARVDRRRSPVHWRRQGDRPPGALVALQPADASPPPPDTARRCSRPSGVRGRRVLQPARGGGPLSIQALHVRE